MAGWEKKNQNGAVSREIYLCLVRGGRGKFEREEMRMVNRVGQMWGSDGGGVLGSLVLGEQNPRTPGNKNSKSVGVAPPASCFEWRERVGF